MRDDVDGRRKAFGDTAAPVRNNELPASLGHHVLEACPAPMIVFENHAGGCLLRYVNRAFARRTGYSAGEILQIAWDGPDMDRGHESAVARLRAAIRERRGLEMPVRIHSKDRATFSAVLQVSPVGDHGTGIPRYAVGVLQERTANREYLSRLERDAHYDPLTGLPNRRLLAERATSALAQVRIKHQKLGVALIDLDDFKSVNDTLGHAAGDAVLCAVGARLAGDLRAGDMVARIGGDEFVLLLHRAGGYSSLASIVERVRRHVRQPMHVHGQLITITCSVGVATCPGDAESLDTLVAHADRAMYRQKAQHRSPQVPAPSPSPQTAASGHFIKSAPAASRRATPETPADSGFAASARSILSRHGDGPGRSEESPG